jgi:thiamine-phosphate pyrophosphorylase
LTSSVQQVISIMEFRVQPLYPIIDPEISPRPLRSLIAELARAGVSLVQLREKKSSSKQFLEDALELRELARQHGLRVIINDRTDIAWLSDAQGVHLGQEDLPVVEARKILGPNKIIGSSTHNLQQALEAQETSADYVAIGPIFATRSKEKPGPIVKWSELQEIRTKVTKPLIAIGGITTENVKSLFEIGVDSVAVIRDILCAKDTGGKVQEFLDLSR